MCVCVKGACSFSFRAFSIRLLARRVSSGQTSFPQRLKWSNLSAADDGGEGPLGLHNRRLPHTHAHTHIHTHSAGLRIPPQKVKSFPLKSFPRSPLQKEWTKLRLLLSSTLKSFPRSPLQKEWTKLRLPCSFSPDSNCKQKIYFLLSEPSPGKSIRYAQVCRGPPTSAYRMQEDLCIPYATGRISAMPLAG